VVSFGNRLAVGTVRVFEGILRNCEFGSRECYRFGEI
jgi:hypothetical protein